MSRYPAVRATWPVAVLLLNACAPADTPPVPVRFEAVPLPSTQGGQVTSLAFGPDGKLYGSVNNGEIRRWPLLGDGTTGPVEVLSSLRTASGGERLLIGLVFDPAATREQPIAWVTHATPGLRDVPNGEARITRLSGRDLEIVQHVVVNLPRSTRDHVTNGITFGPDGAIYFLQGSYAAMGGPDPLWANRSEQVLTAAVLRLDPARIASWPLDARTEGPGAYDPFVAGAPLTVFATGVRNAYDLVWHTNGQLYVPTNGSTNGGNIPASTAGAPCARGGVYAGPAVPGLDNVPAQNDFLYRVVHGGYYGHPNPRRCEFAMNGGNPSGRTDPAEVAQYTVGVMPDANYRGAAYDFGLHRSPDGIIEYRHGRFGAALQGKLLVVRYSQGDDIVALTPAAPHFDISDIEEGLPGLGGVVRFVDPLDLVEHPATGALYVSEYGASRVTLLRPVGHAR